jgi:hypothetical protein
MSICMTSIGSVPGKICSISVEPIRQVQLRSIGIGSSLSIALRAYRSELNGFFEGREFPEVTEGRGCAPEGPRVRAAAAGRQPCRK